ncbi:hypothetical protein AK812_SmicGene47567, partial [Symbiodinium microadriaticum]
DQDDLLIFKAFRLHGGDGSWSTEQQRVAALIVFHC